MSELSKTEDNISYKQWKFAEEYLQHFNADEAYRKVYNSSQTRNAWIILRSRPLIAYIRKRLEEKKATLDRLSDSANNTLLELSQKGSEMARVNASKIIKENEIKRKELDIKLKEIDLKLLEKDSQKSSNEPVRIVIETVEKKPE
jgi:predicted RNase H-like nuclease (RuvC/YqgF family)